MFLKNAVSSLLSVVILFQVATIKVEALSSGEVLTGVNATRVSNGMGNLTINNKLQAAAAMKLADIQQYRYWAHDNSVTGTKWTSFFIKAGYGGRVGENLARNYSSADQVINGWLNSPAHRINLLNQNFKEVGIAVGNADLGKGNEVVVVAEFGVGKNRILSFQR